MLPYIQLFGRLIPTYGLTAMIGVIISFLVLLILSKEYKISKEDTLYCFLFAVIGTIVGAKLLYLITVIPELIKIQNPQMILKYLFGGFVFYGGLIGGILGVFIYCKLFKISFKNVISMGTIIIPLFHSIGRIGCFLTGCCYGAHYHGPLAVVFTHSPIAPNGISLFPIQLVESLCNFLIFIFLLLIHKKTKGTYKTLGWYLVLYSIIRFVLEFVRDDAERGFIGSLSTSQFIGIGLFVVGLFLLIKEYKNKE